MTDEKRREHDLTVDKTMRITTTLSALIALVVGVWFIGRWTDEIEDANVAILQEVHSVLDIAERNERRLQVYIERFGLIHDRMDNDTEDGHHETMMLREFLAAKYGEVLPQ